MENPNKRCNFASSKKTSFDGTIAQSVEQRTENPCVTGSIPVGTTKAIKAVEEIRQLFLFLGG